MKTKVIFCIIIFPIFLCSLGYSYKTNNNVKNNDQGKKEKYPPDIKRILERGELIVGMYYQDMPPFFMYDKQKGFNGLDTKIARGIAKKLGVGLEMNREAKTYQELFEMLALGKVDCVISKFSRTYERAKRIHYTRPYVTLRQALLINRVEAIKRKIDKYPMDYLRKEKVKIGVMAQTSWVEYAKEMFKDAIITEFREWQDIVDSVKNGDIIAAYYDENEIMRLIKKNPDITLYAFAFVLNDKKDYIAIGVPWENTHFLAWLNIYLETEEIEMDVEQLIKEYPETYK